MHDIISLNRTYYWIEKIIQKYDTLDKNKIYYKH